MTSGEQPTNTQETEEPAGILSYLVPGISVLGLIAVLLAIQSQTQTAAANAVAWLPVGYAFGAGMVAAVNPCGFALLPAYIALYLGSGEGASSRVEVLPRLGQAIAVSAVMTLGFILVFGAAGLILSAASAALVQYLPWLGLCVGILLVVMGGRMLGGAMVYQMTRYERNEIDERFFYQTELYSFLSFSSSRPFGREPSTGEITTIGVRSIGHPLCRRALERLAGNKTAG